MTTFGRGTLVEWPLDPHITYLNHGTVGVTPNRVLAAQQALRDAIERQPSRFMLRELTAHRAGRALNDAPLMRQAAQTVAEFLGARGDDVVFVDNITTGANAVLRSFAFEAGDEILVSDYGYGGVTRAAIFAAREHDATVRTVTMPYPVRRASDLVDAFVSGIGPRTRLAIVDHISATTALVLPVAEIAAACRARGVAVLIDGAHAPGAIAVDIPALGGDWYAANLHKWMWTPRSSGILWATPARQSTLKPAVISWGLDQGFTAEFDEPGTRDPTPHLSAPAAIDLMEEWGVTAIRTYNHDLAWSAAQRLAGAWQVPVETPESLIGTMVTIPLPASLGATHDDAVRVRDTLLYRDHVEAPVSAIHGRLHVRVSAQVYNDLSDIDRLANAVLRQASE